MEQERYRSQFLIVLQKYENSEEYHLYHSDKLFEKEHTSLCGKIEYNPKNRKEDIEIKNNEDGLSEIINRKDIDICSNCVRGLHANK